MIEVKIEKNELVIRLPLQTPPVPSSSGKTLVVASAYEIVASYLKKLRPILQSIDRDGDWAQLVDQIRERYRNRPRLM